jgi:antirestriction protein ArdC
MRQDIYSEITASIITALETGVRPWAPGWAGAGGGRFAMPLRHNGTPYRGINVLMLWMATERAGYSAPRWLTFKQALELGGAVRKGEKSSKVIFAGNIEREGEGGETSSIFFQKPYAVFNAEQCDGLPADFAPPPPVSVIEDDARLHECEAFFAGLGASIKEQGTSAFYRPATDEITVPPFVAFNSPAAFYSTLAHECVHWTGHKSRLDRQLGGRFGSNAYAAEELIAELGAAFLCGGFGFHAETREDHAGYLAHWIDVMRADSRAIFTAAAAAQKAADYLLALRQGEAPAPAAKPASVTRPAAAPAAAQLALI